MERLVDEQDDFKVDSLPHRQPVKLPQHRHDVLSSTSSSDQPSCRILYRLQAVVVIVVVVVVIVVIVVVVVII